MCKGAQRSAVVERPPPSGVFGKCKPHRQPFGPETLQPGRSGPKSGRCFDGASLSPKKKVEVWRYDNRCSVYLEC